MSSFLSSSIAPETHSKARTRYVHPKTSSRHQRPKIKSISDVVTRMVLAASYESCAKDKQWPLILRLYMVSVQAVKSSALLDIQANSRPVLLGSTLPLDNSVKIRAALSRTKPRASGYISDSIIHTKLAQIYANFGVKLPKNYNSNYSK